MPNHACRRTNIPAKTAVQRPGYASLCRARVILTELISDQSNEISPNHGPSIRHIQRLKNGLLTARDDSLPSRLEWSSFDAQAGSFIYSRI